ncbi:MAG: cadmium resistance transporter [Mycobacterium sp.]
MELALIGQAAAMFAMTNIDDMVVLAVFFGRNGTSRSGIVRVVLGQYLGFVGILVVSVLGALGARLLPENAIPYLGLLPLFLGLRAAWLAWRAHTNDCASQGEGNSTGDGVGVLAVATVVFANGGDNIGVYVPVFAVVGVGAMTAYTLIFLAGVAIWCAIGWFVASRPSVAKVLARWGHIILPVVLIGVGLLILIEGGGLNWSD